MFSRGGHQISLFNSSVMLYHYRSAENPDTGLINMYKQTQRNIQTIRMRNKLKIAETKSSPFEATIPYPFYPFVRSSKDNVSCPRQRRDKATV